MKNFNSIRFACLFLLLVIAFYLGTISPVFNKEREQRLSQEIKAQLRQELRAEIKQELLAEINQQHSPKQNLAQVPPSATLQNQNIVSSKKAESLDQAVRRIAREVVDQSNHDLGLTDQEMDQYVASGEIESSLPVGSGYLKSSEMVLAKNDPKVIADDKAKKKNIDNEKSALDTTAGAENRSEAVERTLQQRGSMLLGKGKWVIDPTTSWAHFSSNKINLQGVVILDVFTIGLIGAQEINRDVFVQNFGIKYGLLNNLQAEMKIPFRSQYERVTSINASNVPTDEITRSSAGMGDIDLSLSRQIGWEEGWKPDLITAVGFKTRTGASYGNEIAFGSGHYALRTALIASKSSDPAVIFSSLSYTYNFERTGIEGLGDIKPGDVIGYSLGTAIALSYQMAINFSFDNSVVMKTVRNGVNVLDSFVNTANFKTGLNWAIDERKSVNVSISLGLTKDSPDVTLDIGVPISF